ncbi:MAG: hypothetical protein M1829_001930 [Trizodia sp. TS-e1964]|nr:MAG: hypothetical protein M1829_001930 [Trizodia sp. TS-e1964]
MESTAPITQASLLDRQSKSIATLLQRFENIVALASVDDAPLPSTAVATYQIEVHTAALRQIRAAEDLCALTRAMKEMWLFGPLAPLGLGARERAVERGVESDVRAVAGVLEGLLRERGEEGLN